MSPAEPPAETTDLRVGPELHDNLLALLPLVGVWRGTGTGVVASSGKEFAFGQQISFAHDGRPFLSYSSRSWLLDEAGELVRMAFREHGFWRPGPGEDDIEATLADAAGLVEVFTGTAGDAAWDLATLTVTGTPTARGVAGEKRFYAVRGNELLYATELQLTGEDHKPHLNAKLLRQISG